MADLKTLKEEVFKGKGPENLTEVEEIILDVNKQKNALALLVYYSRKNFNDSDAGTREWIAWGKSNLKQEIDFMHNNYKLGAFLYRIQKADRDLFFKIIKKPSDKLHSLSTLTDIQLRQFLHNYSFGALTSEEIQTIVASSFPILTLNERI